MGKSNEVTVKVTSSKEDLIKILTAKGFEKGREFSLDDYYFILKGTDVKKMSTREILSNAVIIRYIVDTKVKKTITFKKKNIDENGDIVSQEAINCNILDIEEAKRLFEAIRIL